MTDEQRTKREVDDNMLISVRTKAWKSYPLIHKELEDDLHWGGMSGKRCSNIGDLL